MEVLETMLNIDSYGSLFEPNAGIGCAQDARMLSPGAAMSGYM